MRKFIITVFITLFQLISHAQDSTLIGRFALSGLGSYTKTNITDEKSEGGLTLQFRYFPSPKAAFVIAYQNLRTNIMRNGRGNKATNGSLGFGFEKYFIAGNLSPYLGLEAGINFTKVKSDLLIATSNSQYFQNNLPNYMIKPKFGFLYALTESLHLQFEGSFNWVFAAEKQNTNPLFDDNGNPIYFGRKAPTVSLGIMYKFGE